MTVSSLAGLFKIIIRSSPGDDLIDLLNSSASVRPYVHIFFDFDVIWYMSRPRPDMRTSMTSTRSKVKVKELLKFRKLHYSKAIFSAILAGSSKLMIDNDSMGPSL